MQASLAEDMLNKTGISAASRTQVSPLETALN